MLSLGDGIEPSQGADSQTFHSGGAAYCLAACDSCHANYTITPSLLTRQSPFGTRQLILSYISGTVSRKFF